VERHHRTRASKGRTALQHPDSEQALTNIDLIHGDAIFLLKDFSRYCENDRVCRRLRELAEKLRAERRSIVITAATMQLPPDLQADAAPFQLGLPSAEELVHCAKQVIAEANAENRIPVSLDGPGTLQLAQNLVGLQQEEAIRMLRKSILKRRGVDAGLIEAVLEAKRQTLRTDGLLETIRRDVSFSDIAGLRRLREWLVKRKSALTPEGQRFGLEPPKGILITGVQGCGKSLAARAVAGEWGFDLARLDAGALYDKFVGESEKKLHRALELAQKLAPLVLWIDEIEKAFASAGSNGDADAGLSQRLLATLLTWIQERQGGVFLVATSNNITSLPPEMLRKAASTRFSLWTSQRRGALCAFCNAPEKARARPSRIRSGKARGRQRRLQRGGDRAGDCRRAVHGLRPETAIDHGDFARTQLLSVTRAEDVQAIRDWAKARAVPAD
jgi:hypothetical protein